eukprot:2161741-Rhodomonas_salina.5
MSLRGCYAMSGTDIAYAAARSMRRSLRSRAYGPTHTLCDVCIGLYDGWHWHAVSVYASTGPDTADQPMRCLAPLPPAVCSAISLRACYAMSDTDLAYGAVNLRAQCDVRRLSKRYRIPPMVLCCRYAMSGAKLAYAASRLLCDVRY